jgi:sporulation protein YlmC with PRC-barrel domain
MRLSMNVEITALLGLEVYDQTGVYVGRVDDVVLDPEKGVVSGLAVGDVNRDLFEKKGKGKGIIVPYQWVAAVGDIILIRHMTRNAKTQRKDS